MTNCCAVSRRSRSGSTSKPRISMLPAETGLMRYPYLFVLWRYTEKDLLCRLQQQSATWFLSDGLRWSKCRQPPGFRKSRSRDEIGHSSARPRARRRSSHQENSVVSSGTLRRELLKPLRMTHEATAGQGQEATVQTAFVTANIKIYSI